MRILYELKETMTFRQLVLYGISLEMVVLYYLGFCRV
jgi:hypothetical protein